MKLNEMRLKDYIVVFLKGVLLGLLSLGIPGVSASTVGIIVGIYFLMVESIANIFKNFKTNVKFLLSLSLGYGVGAVGAAFSVTVLFRFFPFAVACVIIGIILGSIINSVSKLKGDFKSLVNWIVFFAVFILLGVYNFVISSGQKLTFPSDPHVFDLISMAFIGFFTSTTFIIPGVDFAVVFLSFGIYYPFMNMLTEIFSFGAENYLSRLVVNVQILGSYLVGYLLGIFLISKLIKKLNDRFGKQMQFASFAFLVAAPAVFLQNCLSSETFFISVPQAIVGGILGVLCVALMVLFMKYGDKKHRELEVKTLDEPAAETANDTGGDGTDTVGTENEETENGIEKISENDEKTE